ncbi:MAG: hypothetical protein IKC08_03635 [Lentisphaeria bacterium]|nr:hypothetical protein [Lentisphaeria bacterium]
MRTFGKFTVNTSAVQKNIVRAMAQNRQKAVRTMTDVGHFLRGEIQDRTPVKEGFLTAEILFAVRENQQSVSTAMYVPSNAQSKDYAISMHESFYLLGPGSLEKQRKVNVTVGRKFITRGIDENRSTILDLIADGMKH